MYVLFKSSRVISYK